MLQEFVDSRRPKFFRKHKGAVKPDTVIKAVKTNELFGMVEVDIRVPEEFPDDGVERELTPKEYFAEMSPIFCNVNIPFESVGEHMKQYAEKMGLSQKPRRQLVGGMKARKILLATPLLKWYLDHGMVVDRVHQVVEFLPQRCFKQFADDVSNARRDGDRHPDLKVMSETMKLLGNASYGYV